MVFNQDEIEFIENALDAYFREAVEKLKKPHLLGEIEQTNYESQKRKAQELMKKLNGVYQ